MRLIKALVLCCCAEHAACQIGSIKSATRYRSHEKGMELRPIPRHKRRLTSRESSGDLQEAASDHRTALVQVLRHETRCQSLLKGCRTGARAEVWIAEPAVVRQAMSSSQTRYAPLRCTPRCSVCARGALVARAACSAVSPSEPPSAWLATAPEPGRRAARARPG